MVTDFELEWDTRIDKKQWLNQHNEVVSLTEMSELHIKKCLSMMTESWVYAKKHEANVNNSFSSKAMIARKIQRVDAQIAIFKEELLRRVTI